MGLLVTVSSKIFLLWILLEFVKCQDQNYFFTSPNAAQGRFVPSFQNSKTPSYLSGSRNSLANADSSYSDHLVFLNDESSANSPLLTTGFSPFAQQLQLQQTTRNPNFYDISPRPFGSLAGSQGFTKPKELRSSSSGFTPISNHQTRSNVPHQQSQFLSHFNEQNIPITAPALTSSLQPNRINGENRLFGGLSNSFSRNRPFSSNSFNRQQQQNKQVDGEIVTPAHQQLPFRNTRTRFQPSSAKISSTTTSTSTTSKPLRYNRFSPARPSLATEFRQTAAAPSQGIKTRAIATAVNKTLFQPRRPVFISREINRPVSGGASQITIKHNGSDKNSPNITNNPKEEDIESDEKYDSLAEEIHEPNHVSSGPKDNIFEKLSLHEAVASPIETDSETSHSITKQHAKNTVILTSNFYLPGSENDQNDENDEEEEEIDDVEQNENSDSKEQNNEKVRIDNVVPETTHHLPEYDYEYEDENITTTQSMEEDLDGPATEIEDKAIDGEIIEVNNLTLTEKETSTESVKPTDATTFSTPDSTAFYEEGEEYDDSSGSGEFGSDVTESGELKEKNTAKEKDPGNEIIGREVVSVVTTKSVINGSTAIPHPVTPSSTILKEEEIYMENKLTPANETVYDESDIEESQEETAGEQNVNNTTESYVVIASIQTSRSINGARFLPFPAIEQEETKQTLSELERKIHGKNSRRRPQQSESSETESNEITSDGNSTNITFSNDMTSSTTDASSEEDDAPKEMTTVAAKPTTSSRFAPNIRKFMPKTTSKPKINIENLPMDDLTGLLPAGFKPRSSYTNKKLQKPSSTTPGPHSSFQDQRKPHRNFTIGRSYKNSPNAAQDIALPKSFPKRYTTTQSPSSTIEAPTKKIQDILSKLKFEESVDKLIPTDYKEKISTTKAPVTIVEDISKFLPPGFKLPNLPTTTKPEIKIEENLSKFLPSDYKSPLESKVPIKVSVADDLSKFLPPGFKLEEKQKEAAIDISKFLPKDYKLENKEQEVAKKNKPNESKLSPPEKIEMFTTETTTTVHEPVLSTTSVNSGLKVVFPKGFNRRPGQRLTTPHGNSAEVGGGSTSPTIVIKKGPPTRATTEFTGWPTPSTTPISIEKLLEQARTATIDISELLPGTSTMSTTSTSSTTTTTPEPPRPTKPGHCKSDCDLAGTIKIIDGVSWKPELLDHNTAEWKNLAREVELQLNEVYSTAPHLSKWYKKVRIDSFSKGSVLVDYFVELSNITEDVNTLEIKKLFHQALIQPPLSVVPLQHEPENETDIDSEERKSQKQVKETYLMGRFVVDPSSTDFIVIPKSFAPTVEYAEDEALIPHWAIVLIVIGIGSLCFVVIFGVTVLINRQKNSKKSPMPLTADMMNDLKVSHMGGADNYGVDDFYNVDDAWNDTKQPIKPKRFTNSMHGSSASNIYDSWRSTRHGDYYYDPHNYTPHNKAEQYASDAFADVHQMYTYNNPRSKYQRDYDPDF